VGNHNAEIRAHNLREWFSPGFLKPVISTALPRLLTVRRHLAEASERLAARRFRTAGPLYAGFTAAAPDAVASVRATVAVDST